MLIINEQQIQQQYQMEDAIRDVTDMLRAKQLIWDAVELNRK